MELGYISGEGDRMEAEDDGGGRLFIAFRDIPYKVKPIRGRDNIMENAIKRDPTLKKLTQEKT